MGCSDHLVEQKVPKLLENFFQNHFFVELRDAHYFVMLKMKLLRLRRFLCESLTKVASGIPKITIKLNCNVCELMS